jgi:hypothetical protein
MVVYAYNPSYLEDGDKIIEVLVHPEQMHETLFKKHKLKGLVCGSSARVRG